MEQKRRIKVGIIGCGEVVQINHLPSLKYLEELFEVVAVADIDARVVEKVSSYYQIPYRFTDYLELLRLPQVEAVLIATPHVYHTEQTIAALASEKHVLVEKPMSITLREVDRIIEAQKRTGLVVQVGYMRRYATAFLEAVRRLGKVDDVCLAEVHDVIGENSLIIQPTSRVVKSKENRRVVEMTTHLYEERLEEAVGERSEVLYQVYSLLIGLSTHDISAMRELLGIPQKVLYAAHKHNGRYITAAFDYGDFVCHFETGINKMPYFGCYITVYRPSSVLRVVYQTPYVRHLATHLEVLETPPSSNNTIHTQTFKVAFEDNFTEEWKAFYENIVENKTPKTDPEDYRKDLEIFREIIKKIKETV